MSVIFTQSVTMAIARLAYVIKKPSACKINAESEIALEVYARGGYGYTVISYNTHMFTCGYLYQHGGATYFVIHTPTDRDVMLVKED